MPKHGVDSLTEAERRVLRLIAQHVTETKELTRRLGTAPGTIKSQVGSAMAKLNATSRKQAAAILAKAEGLHPLGPNPSSTMGGDAPFDQQWLRQPTEAPTVVREEWTAFPPRKADTGTADLHRKINDLSMGLRVVVIATIAVTAAVLALLLVPTSNKAQVIGSAIANH